MQSTAIARTIGKVFQYQNTSVQGLLLHKQEILQGVSDHGCICIKNVDFNEKDQTDFTRGMWDQVVILPEMFSFSNKDPKNMEIIRIGNVLPNGTLKDATYDATIWHQDGDYWGEERKQIFSCLHTRELPEQGGDTWFMDLVKAVQFLKQKKPNVYEKLRKQLGILDLLSIQDFKRSNAYNSLGIDSVTKHDIIRKDRKTGKQMIYLSAHKYTDKNEALLDIQPQPLIKQLQREFGYYTHKWQKGDMLVFDNCQVLHRAAGYFKGRRLLFHTQGRTM